MGPKRLLALTCGVAAFLFSLHMDAAAWTAAVGGGASSSTDGGSTYDSFPVTYVTNSDGSQSVSGSGSVGAYSTEPLGFDHIASVSGMASCGPGGIKCFAHGLALNFSHDPNVTPLPNTLGVQGGFSGTFTDYLTISNASPALTNGSAARFHMTIHSRGGSTGTYRVGGQFDVTAYAPGGYYLSVYAGANAGVNYYFPNGLFQQVPDNLNFDIPLDVDAHVGDSVLIYYSLAVSVEDRTGGPWFNGAFYGNSESIVDVSHTITVNIDPITPGTALYSDSGHNYASHSPRIDSIAVSGPNVIVGGSQGSTNGTYYVYSSTDMTSPLVNWTYLASQVFDTNGNFAFTNSINPTEAKRFYYIRTP
jgi:hypothetical protein